MTIYVYALETLADWEIGYVTAELHSKRFFKENAPSVTLKTVSSTLEPIQTMGGLTILPDVLMDDMDMSKESVLILPGANTWHEPNHDAIIDKAKTLLELGGTVCAICGATVALANAGLLNHRPHTSNGAGFLEMVSPSYQGQSFYVDEPSVSDNGLITAGSTAGLLWAKQIIESLGVFEPSTLAAWYDYFRTGEARHFYALMETLPSNGMM